MAKWLFDVFPNPYLLQHAMSWIERQLKDEEKGKNFCIGVKNEDGTWDYAGGIGFKVNAIPNEKHCVEVGYGSTQ